MSGIFLDYATMQQRWSRRLYVMSTHTHKKIVSFFKKKLTPVGTSQYESKILDGEIKISKLKAEIEKNNIKFERFQSILNQFKNKLNRAEKNNLDNENIISEYNNKIEELFNITNMTNEKIATSEPLYLLQ